MSPPKHILAPRVGEASLVEITPLWPAGTVTFAGTAGFPRYWTAQLEDPALAYRVVLHVHTSERGAELVGLQLAPLPGAAVGDVEFPSIQAVARQLNAEPFIRTVGMAIAADLAGLSFDVVADASHPEHPEALDVLTSLVAASGQFKTRKYRRRSPELLREVASIYIRECQAGNPAPNREIQRLVGGGTAGYSTVAAWVREAREAKLIPPAIKGRPGWDEGEQS